MLLPCRIYNLWLIITTTFVSALFFEGCMPPRDLTTGERMSRKNIQASSNFSSGLVHNNPRKKKNNNTYRNTSSNNLVNVDNTKSNTEFDNSEIDAFEKKIFNSKSNNQTKESNSNKILPSLKEQINELNKNQAEIEEKIEEIKDDMSELKNILQNISNSESSLPNTNKNTNKPASNSFVLASDENILEIDNTEQRPVTSNSNYNSSNNASSNVSKSTTNTGTNISSNNNNVIKKSTPPKKKQPEKATVKTTEGPAIEKKEDASATNNTNTTNNTNNAVSISSTAEAPNNSLNNNFINNIDNSGDFSDVINKIAKGELTAATKVLNNKLRTSKDQKEISNCYYWLGECSFRQKDYAKAIVNYKTAIKENTDKKDIAQAKIAESYMRAGRNNEAKAAYQALLDNYPKSALSSKAKKMLQQL